MRSRLRVVYFGRGDYFAATFLDAIERDHDWRAHSLEKSDGATTRAGTVGRAGYRFFVHHPEGRIWLSPRFWLTFVRRALRRRLLPGV